MNSMLQTVVPKSDQLNADSLMGGQTLIIKVTKVSMVGGEQPVIINYDGDNGRPYKPGKSMRRILIKAWGADVKIYVGRRMKLYCDETVKFGAVDVGGIRISHVSDIEESITMALTVSRANKKPFTVHPLVPEVAEFPSVDEYLQDIKAAPTLDGLQYKYKEAYRIYKDDPRNKELTGAKDARKIELNPTQELKNEEANNLVA